MRHLSTTWLPGKWSGVSATGPCHRMRSLTRTASLASCARHWTLCSRVSVVKPLSSDVVMASHRTRDQSQHASLRSVKWRAVAEAVSRFNQSLTSSTVEEAQLQWRMFGAVRKTQPGFRGGALFYKNLFNC